MRRRVDGNQKEIVEALERAGCKVFVLSNLGHGIYDLLVGYNGVLHLVEVKDLTGRSTKPTLTPAQAKFTKEWEGYPIHIVTNELQALLAVGVEVEVGRRYSERYEDIEPS